MPWVSRPMSGAEDEENNDWNTGNDENGKRISLMQRRLLLVDPELFNPILDNHINWA